MKREYVRQRGGVWYYWRRVPVKFREVDARTFVRKTTETTDYAEAMIIASNINSETEKLWRALLADPGASDMEKYEQAVSRAQALGVRYMPLSELANGELEELQKRLELLETKGLVHNEAAQDAALGGREPPNITLNDMLAIYMDLCRDILGDKDRDQLRKWQNLRKRAIANFKLALSTDNKALSELHRNDALEFRSWWMDRVMDEGLTKNAGNKELSAMNVMLTEIDDKYQIGLNNPFAGVRLRGEDEGCRPPYARDFIQQRVLASGALDRLNAEARAILLLVIFNGMRPSEACNLSPNEIHLAGRIPYLHISGAFRKLKTRHAYRDLPLVPALVPIMTEHPGGFPRYRGKPENFSGLMNKYLLNNDLRPTKMHTVYSFRHTFQDSLTALEVPDRVQTDLMGHKFASTGEGGQAIGRIKYGSGAALEQKLKWLTRVAYQLPPG